MILLAADENIDWTILSGVERAGRNVKIPRAQLSGLEAQRDHLVRAWAASEDRVLVTHDAATMEVEAYARVAANQSMPGVLILPQSVSVGDAVRELLLIVECGTDEDFRDRVTHLPL